MASVPFRCRTDRRCSGGARLRAACRCASASRATHEEESIDRPQLASSRATRPSLGRPALAHRVEADNALVVVKSVLPVDFVEPRVGRAQRRTDCRAVAPRVHRLEHLLPYFAAILAS